MYQRDVTGNLEAGHQTLELWVATYPHDSYVHGLLSGFCSQGTGRYEQSIEEAKKALAIDPDFTPAYINLGFSHFYLDHLGEAKSVVAQALGRKMNVPEILLLNFYLAFLDGDEKGMSEAAALAKNVPAAEDWMTYLQALTLARSGGLRMAGETTERAMELARQSGQPERAATYEAGEADWEALTGNSSAAAQDATTALKSSRGRDVEYASAFALAVVGDYARAKSIANDLAKRFAEDTSVKFNYLPALRGLFALQDGSPEHAIELLQPAVAYEFAVPSVDFNTFFGGLNPIWVRGRAYLAEHKGAEAAAEFQKIIDHQGVLGGDPIGALAHLELGKAYAIAGDRTKAKMAFKDFLSLWKDADREIPLLEQAKVDYAKLQ
jgi:tetratricopeptide (TPR) repeat protein